MDAKQEDWQHTAILYRDQMREAEAAYGRLAKQRADWDGLPDDKKQAVMSWLKALGTHPWECEAVEAAERLLAEPVHR